MADNDTLYQKAIDAIAELYSDTFVPQSNDLENLESLREEIIILMSTLKLEE